MEDLSERVTKAVQIKMIHEMLNGNNKYYFDFENLNNNKRTDSESPSKKRSGSPKTDSPSRKTTDSPKKKGKKGKKGKTESSSKKKMDHCIKEEEEEDQTLDEGAPNLTSYQKVVDRVFNTHMDKMANKLTCLCTMNCAAMLIPKATEFIEAEDELKKRIQGGGCTTTTEGESSSKKTKSSPEDDEDESS